LLRLKEYKPSLNIRIAIAGRDEPGAKWDPLRSVTQTICIDVFTEQEAEAFLDTFGITDPKRRKDILELSGRLPVLMSWLAAVGENDTETSLPTHDIVERFLRWVIEPALKHVALLAAFPRYFNMDILKLLLEKHNQTIDEQSSFDWLQTMPFVKQDSEGWHYHDIVRRMMLHYQRQKSPQMYRQMHIILAKYYDDNRHELGLSTDEQWINEQWHKYTFAYLYHHLIADINKHWADIMSLFVVALRKNPAFAEKMIVFLSLDDVHDELSKEQNDILKFFAKQLRSKNIELKDRIAMFDKLCNIPDLSNEAKGYTLANRGAIHLLIGKHKQALSDIEEALNYIPKDAFTIAERGMLYIGIGQYQKALADFKRAIDLDRNNSWIIILRGMTYRKLGRYQEALADFDRAITPDEKDTWTFTLRGITYLFLERYQEALADFDHAIALDEKNILAFVERASTYILQGHYQEALADFDRIISLDEENAFKIIDFNLNDIQSKRPKEVLTELSQVISSVRESSQKMEPSEMVSVIFDKFITKLGEIYQGRGGDKDALEMFDKAITLNEQNVLAIVSRGKIYQLLGRYQEALADFDRAIALDDQIVQAIADRGETLRLMGRYQEALIDFDHAIALDDQNAWVIGCRGQAYCRMGRYQEALIDFDRAIALDKKLNWVIFERGIVFSYLGQYAKAIQSYQQGSNNDPNDCIALYNIAVATARWKGIPEAKFQIYKARTALNKEKIDSVRLYGLGGLAALTGNFDLALDYLNQAIQSTKQVADVARFDLAWLDLTSDPHFQALILIK